MKTGSWLRASVIVPVFNHWELVPELLACLKVQTLAPGMFELLIVDNGSDAMPQDPDLPPWARLLHCPIPGSYAARNLAIAAAQGEVLVFTDADCRPEPDWLVRGLACLDGMQAAGVVAGDIRVVPQDASAPTSYEIYDMILGLPQRRYVERGYAITANLFVPRAVMDATGDFDARRYSGGDADFCRRAVAAGFDLLFCAEAVVRHPARRVWEELTAKARRIKGGQVAAGSFGRRLSYVFRTLIPPVHVWRIALRAKAFPLRQRLTVCAIKLRLWGVEIQEMLRLLLGAKSRRQ